MKMMIMMILMMMPMVEEDGLGGFRVLGGVEWRRVKRYGVLSRARGKLFSFIFFLIKLK